MPRLASHAFIRQLYYFYSRIILRKKESKCFDHFTSSYESILASKGRVASQVYTPRDAPPFSIGRTYREVFLKTEIQEELLERKREKYGHRGIYLQSGIRIYSITMGRG